MYLYTFVDIEMNGPNLIDT